MSKIFDPDLPWGFWLGAGLIAALTGIAVRSDWRTTTIPMGIVIWLPILTIVVRYEASPHQYDVITQAIAPFMTLLAWLMVIMLWNRIHNRPIGTDFKPLPHADSVWFCCLVLWFGLLGAGILTLVALVIAKVYQIVWRKFPHDRYFGVLKPPVSWNLSTGYIPFVSASGVFALGFCWVPFITL